MRLISNVNVYPGIDDSKLNIFRFWTAAQTKRDTRIRRLGFQETDGLLFFFIKKIISKCINNEKRSLAVTLFTIHNMIKRAFSLRFHVTGTAFCMFIGADSTVKSSHTQ